MYSEQKMVFRVILCMLFLTGISRLPAENQEVVAYWSMDEIKNNVIADKSGHGNDAYVMGEITLDTGKEGKAVFFNGKSGNCLLVHPGKELDDLVEFCIEGWIKYTSLFALENGKDNYPTFLNRGDYKKYPAFWLFPGFHSKNIHNYCRLTTWIGTRQDWSGVKGASSDALNWEKDKWYWVRVIVSMKKGTIQFFRDGLKVGENPLSPDYTFGTGDIYIGAYQQDGFPMCGLIDELKIYRTTVSEAEYPAEVKINLDRKDGIYACGKQAVFSVSVTRKGVPVTSGSIKYFLTVDGASELSGGELTLEGNPAEIRGTLESPGILRCTVIWKCAEREVKTMIAAAFEPEKIEPTTKEPEDFLEFWNKKKEELSRVPVDAALTKIEKYSTSRVTVYKVKLANIRNSHVYGMIGIPTGGGAFPAILHLPSAGIYPLDTSWLYWAEKGYIAMGITIHDCEPDLPSEAYKKMPELAGYSAMGREDRETFYFLRAILGCIRSVDYLASRADWDGKNIIVQGSSQGGGLAIITAGLDDRVTAVAAHVPAFCENTGHFHGRPRGWPGFVPEGNETIAKVGAYYDAVNCARHISCPVLMSVGFIDTTCPPTTVYSAFNVIKTSKLMVASPTVGHDITKESSEAEKEWIAKQIK